MRHGHLVQSPHRREPQRRLGRGAEELQHRDGGGELLTGGPLHVDDGVRSFVDHHLGLVPQTRLHKVKVWRTRVRILLLNHLASNPDEQDDRVGTLEAHLGQFGQQLGDGETVGLPDVVEQPEGVVLHHDVVRADGLLHLVHPSLDHLSPAPGPGEVERGHQRRGGHGRVAINDGLLHVALYSLNVQFNALLFNITIQLIDT